MRAKLNLYAIQMVFVLVILAFALPMVAAENPSAKAGGIPRMSDGHPDFNGIFAAEDRHDIVQENGKTRYLQRNNVGEIPDDPNYTKARALNQVTGVEKRKEAYQKNPNLAPPYKPELLAKVRDLELHQNEVDPAFHCVPAGLPRVGPPRQIVHGDGMMAFLYISENGSPYRVIPTDGRPHRTDLSASYMGDSVGHWEGDTLVIDSTNFVEDTWLGTDGWFHSDKLHVIERISREGDSLKWQVTVEDPVVFTKPWVREPVMRKFSKNKMDLVSDPTAEEAPCKEVDSEHIVNHDHL